MAAFDATLRPLLWNPDEIVRPFVAEGDSVVDIGCGAGYYAAALSRLIGPHGELFLVDVQEDMLERSMRRLRRERRDGPASAGAVPLLSAGDRFDLPGKVDFALMSWMLHEVERPRILWESVRQYLRPIGKVLVIEPWLHVRRGRFEEEIAYARDLGFAITEIDDIFFCHACVATRGGR